MFRPLIQDQRVFHADASNLDGAYTPFKASDFCYYIDYSIFYKTLCKGTFARYRSMHYGVNRGDCRAEFLLKIHIRDCQVSRGLSSSPDET